MFSLLTQTLPVDGTDSKGDNYLNIVSIRLKSVTEGVKLSGHNQDSTSIKINFFRKGQSFKYPKNDIFDIIFEMIF